MEIWRTIPGYDGLYDVSDMGAVRSWRRKVPKRLKPIASRSGHHHVFLYSGSGREFAYVHRLVLLAFQGPAPDGTQGCHNNGNPSDNRIENLRWDSAKANYADAVRHGAARPDRIGEQHHKAKLWDDAVRAIRAEPNYRGVLGMLARCFGVRKGLIAEIRMGKGWEHVVT